MALIKFQMCVVRMKERFISKFNLSFVKRIHLTWAFLVPFVHLHGFKYVLALACRLGLCNKRNYA
jgi:hypothetical protein